MNKVVPFMTGCKFYTLVYDRIYMYTIEIVVLWAWFTQITRKKCSASGGMIKSVIRSILQLPIHKIDVFEVIIPKSMILHKCQS